MVFPETISAIAIDKTGGIEVLEKKTVPFPTQKPGEIVVKVSETSLSRVLGYILIVS